MDLLQVDVKLKYFSTVILLLILCQISSAWNQEYSIHNSRGSSAFWPVDIVTLDGQHSRARRDAPLGPTAVPATGIATAVPVTAVATGVATGVANSTATAEVSNATVNTTENGITPVPTATVTQIPLLGVNGSGTLKVNLTENTPKVSDPIVPDDNFTDIFKETPERIKSEQNLTNLTYDNHDFYNSTFIGNVTYFNEYWANISKPAAEVHAILSNSHRRATSLQLKFAFPFYGHYIQNITVATGGFVYTGEHVHNWLAATQYIAPLMANFDTTLTNDSYVKLYDDAPVCCLTKENIIMVSVGQDTLHIDIFVQPADWLMYVASGEKFTAFWENVNLQDDANKTFTFAVTLYKNGDIIFAYKDIPVDVQQINDTQHPVKVGISDAYLNDNIMFLVRRKTIYEYHRVSFRNHVIASNTILKLTALPTCLQYDSCESCLNHNTSFNCTWCPQIQKCSSGTDRNKQDWKLRNCDRTTVREEASCSAGNEGAPPGNKTMYNTDTPQPPNHNTTIDIISDPVPTKTETSSTGSKAIGIGHAAAEPQRSAVGGVVAAFLAITLLCGSACWVVYAFKNPHTRSGQLLIKYRPSQWSWRRGEARYTAATIHM